MLRKYRACLMQSATSQTGMVSALLLLSVTFGGCSADVGRFDFASVNATSDQGRSAPTPSEPLRRNAGIPVDTEQTYQRPPDGIDRTPPGGAREPAVRMSGLPDPVSTEPQARAAPRASAKATTAGPGRQIPTAAATRAPAKPGEVIEVQQGDTLYGISKRYRVAISELMAVNNLQNPNIRPGQKLTVPGGKRAVVQRPTAAAAAEQPAPAPVKPQKAARIAPVPAAAPAPVAPVAPVAAAPAAEWNGSYTVAQGDSLFAIARKHKIKAADLQSVNNITDPTKVRPGTVLKVPGDGTAPVAAAPASAPATVPAVAATPAAPAAAKAAAIQSGAAAGAPSGAKPKIINAATEPVAQPETRVAALGSNAPVQSDATAAAPKAATPAVAGATGKFRWPVKGKVITNFGPRADNTHNDGINISVPSGTDVLAAEAGTVAYAGSELKGYGNLILVRHEGNWVSAYAHNDQLLVKRGDKVKRGQAIAKAGNTGSVDQPQVHFELRQGSKPIDPVPYMEKN